MGGSFTQAGLGNFARSGGTVLVVGTLTGNVTLDTSTGPWLFGGSGTLKDSQLISNTPIVVNNTFALDNVTIASGTELQVQTGGASLAVRNGLTVNGRLAVGSATTSGTVSLGNTQTIAGSGEIVFGSAVGNAVSTSTTGLANTFGPNLALRGKNVTFSSNGNTNYIFQGLIQPDVAAGVFTFNANVTTAAFSGRVEPINGSSLVFNGGALTNNGQVIATAGNTVRLTPTGAHINNGSISSTGGSLTIGGQLNNLGTISVSNTDVMLAGSLTQFALGSATPVSGQGTFTRTGGTVTLTGVLTGNLTLDAATGPWLFGGSGTLKDSQLISNTLIVVNNTFALDNVTIASGTEVQVQTGGASLAVRNGLAVNGRLAVGSATIAGIVSLGNTQSIAGSGEIVFGAAIGNAVSTSTTGLTITYGPNLTLRGKNVTFSSNGNTNYVFQGLIKQM